MIDTTNMEIVLMHFLLPLMSQCLHCPICTCDCLFLNKIFLLKEWQKNSKLHMIFVLIPSHKAVKANDISVQNVVSLLFTYLQHMVTSYLK